MATSDATPPATLDATATTETVPYELSPQKMLFDTVGYLAVLFLIFYFLLIRPQQKRTRAHQTMLKGLQKGVRVITGGGIIGTIVKLESDDVALVEIAQGVRVRVSRASISEVMDGGAASGTANDN